MKLLSFVILSIMVRIRIMTISERLQSEKVKINDCPFCGCKLSEFPYVMIVQPVRSDEYLLAKLNKGDFLGGENGYHVHCINCGASGGRDTIPEVAINKWNRRVTL
ncbi:MAG: Lar family restriction alleviation protein [Oscillospiraceae bacterium]|nr:Lar family restriction alleviation protein [Oscillospiraceae bacterium]